MASCLTYVQASTDQAAAYPAPYVYSLDGIGNIWATVSCCALDSEMSPEPPADARGATTSPASLAPAPLGRADGQEPLHLREGECQNGPYRPHRQEQYQQVCPFDKDLNGLLLVLWLRTMDCMDYSSRQKLARVLQLHIWKRRQIVRMHGSCVWPSCV